MAKARHRYLIIILLCLITFLIILNKSLNYDEEPDIGWYPNTSKNLSDYIKTEKNTAIIEPIDICQSDEKVLVIIAVASAPANFERRLAIRETWGNTSYFNYNLIKKLHGESSGKYLEVNISDWEEYIEEVSVKRLLK